jgi:TonB-linked SusC/RagA family outer membrane protein
LAQISKLINMRKKLSILAGMLILFVQLAVAQNVDVSGTVTDDKGAPIVGASVQERGSNRGTTTDEKGNFKLSVKRNSTIEVSSVGFDKKTSSAGSGGTIDFQLVPATNQNLTEVVVTALGIKREKKALGYAVSTVDKKQLELRPEGDVVRLLNGKAPGVNIGATSGLSGSGTNILIRGLSSISGNSTPLFIVDGVPFDGSTNAQTDFRFQNQTSSRFLDLDPNNIENISVLKGLSATTLYGEQGRNGVILVTTKNGSTGRRTNKKAEVSFQQSYFTNTIANLPTFQNTYSGGFNMSSGLTFFSNWGAPFQSPARVLPHPYDRSNLNAAFPEFIGKTYEEKAYPNNVRDFFRTGIISTTSVSVSGNVGNNVSMSGSYSYLDDKGFTPGNNVFRHNFGFGANAKLSNRFTLNFTANHVLSDVVSPPNARSDGSGASNGIGVFTDLLYTPRSLDLMNLPFQNPLDGSTVAYRAGNDIQNPRWTVANSFVKQKTQRTFGQMSLRFEVLNNLNFTYRVGFDNYTEGNDFGVNKGANDGFPLGIFRTTSGQNTIWDHTLFGNYQKQLSDNFNLNIEGGVNSRENIYRQTGVTSTQQLVFGLFNHGNFIDQSFRSEDGGNLTYQVQQQSIGAFAQTTLGYREYLFATVGARNSWVSTLEKDNRNIFYPSFSLSFLPTSAISSLQGNKMINYTKIRAGYSTSARFPDPYSTRQSSGVNPRVFLDKNNNIINTNSIPNRLPNPGLKPELLTEVELGLEGKFVNNRLSVDFTWYNRTSKDQILDQQLDPATGYTVKSVNGGNVRNRGIEVALGITPVRTKNWNYTLTWNFTRNRNLVTFLPADIKQIPVAGFTNLGAFAIQGQPLGVLQGLYVQRDATKGNQRIVSGTGDYLPSTEIGIIGDPNPDYQTTLVNDLSFKQFSFRMQWDYTHGGDMYSGTARALLGRGLTKDTEFDRYLPIILPGVKQDGTPNNIQSSATSIYFNNFGFGPDDLGVYDASVVRLREISLSYSLPTEALKKTPFGRVAFTVSGQNLWYKAPNFPKYLNFDPETSGLGVSSYRGLEFITGPSSRRIGASVNITF